MISDHGRSFGSSDDQIRLRDCLAIESAKIERRRPRGALTGTETFFAADIERQFRLALSLGRPEKSNHATEVIVMAVAQHHGVELGRIDAEYVKVVQQRG